MQPLDAEDPRAIGPYRLLRRLGAGGMGRVYLGRSSGGRTVAVKAVHPHFASDEQFRARFRREVTAARRVGGDWTAPVLDAGPDDRIPWVATGYVAGPPLGQAVDTVGALPEHTVRTLGAGLAEALAAVHGLDLVHRDVKPSNVLLTMDGPRLIDFGIARATDGTASLTASGVSIGSPGYMSPEQILGREVTGASDVFSLGAVLAYAARARDPFPGDSSASLLYKVVHEEPELDGLDGELRELVAACLAKDPADRPAVPTAFTGTWQGAVEQSNGFPNGNLTVVVEQGDKGDDVARLTYSMLSASCHSKGELVAVTEKKLTLRETTDESKDNPEGLCTGDPATVTLTVTGEDRLVYQSDDERGGEPSADLRRADG